MLIEQQLSNAITTTEASSKIAGMLDPVKTDKEGNQSEKQPKKKPQANAAEAEPGQSKALTVADAESAKGKKPAKETPQPSDEEISEDADDGETSEDQDENSQDQDEEAGDDADAQGENDEGENDDETMHTVKIDGKEVEVPYTELIAGYQRNADYSRKMADLTKQRKDVEALQEQVKDLPQVREQAQKSAERFVQNAGLVLKALEQRFMPKAPDLALAEKDPAAFLKAKELHQESLQFMNGLAGEIKQIEVAQQNQLIALVKEGRQKLMTMQPELNDAGNRQKLKEYANGLGFTDQQMAMEPNPVLFQLAYKAMRYDEIMNKSKIQPEHKKPKVMKSTKAPVEASAIQQRKRAETLNAHKQTGTVTSAASALSGILKNSK